MSEIREGEVKQISHYIEGSNGEFIGFPGYPDSVKIRTDLYGKKLGKYGEVNSYNFQLAADIEAGLVDKDGQIIEQENLEKGNIDEDIDVKGHKNEPRTNRANSGKRPSRGVNPDLVDWLENGPGRHDDVVEKGITPNTLNKLWNIFLEINKDFNEDDLDFYRKIEILEENGFVFQNNEKEYELSEKGKRKLDDLKRQEQTRSSLENKKRMESEQESDEPYQRISKALNGIKSVTSFTITPKESASNIFIVVLNLQDGSQLSKLVEVKEKTTLKNIRTKFVNLLKNKQNLL
ncbi:MAG: hypothetical protein PHQ18_04905 [Patescibacteria group bacterium]|nr:hypothetical protein [Patescibacteria group bacterium]